MSFVQNAPLATGLAVFALAFLADAIKRSGQS